MILKKKLFKTFLFELLVMAFIPIILFTAYVHHSIFKKFNNNLNELQKSYFFTASSNFTKTLDNAVETAMFISEDNRVRNYITWQSQNAITSTEFMQTEYDIKKQLNTFMGTNSAIDSIYIYNENAGKILNSGIGTINVKHFHDTSWLEDYKSIHDSLGVHILPERTPCEPEYSYIPDDFPTIISVAVPITINSHPKCNALVLINIKKENLLDTSNTQDYSYIIYTAEKNIIASYYTSPEDAKLYKKIMDEKQSESSFQLFQSSPVYYASYKTLANLHITYSLFTTDDQLSRSLRSMEYFILILLSISILLCIFMAYRLALKYCVPIITISNDIQEFIPMEKSNGNIKDISTAVTTLTHKYHELKEKNISSLDTLFQPFLSGDPQENNRFFCVVASIDDYIKVSSKKTPSEINAFKKGLIQATSTEFSEKVLQCKGLIFDNDRFVLAYLCQQKITSSEIITLVNTMNRQTDSGITISAGVGNIYDMPKDLLQSYIEANEAVNYRFSLGKKCVAFYDEVVSKRERCKIKIPKISKMYPQLTMEEITEQFQNYFEQLSSKLLIDENTELEYIFPVISDLSLFLSNNGLSINDITHSEEPVYISVSKFDTFDEICQYLCNICSEFSNALKNLNNDTNRYISQINELIQTDYANPQLDIAMAAEKIGISYSYICKIVKESKQSSFTILLNHYRIETSKKLLLTTNHSIKQIAEEVGYINDQSYSRYFKKFENMTPGKYRTLNLLNK